MGQANTLPILIAVHFLDEALLLELASLFSLPDNILCFPNIFMKPFLCEIFLVNSDTMPSTGTVKTGHLKVPFLLWFSGQQQSCLWPSCHPWLASEPRECLSSEEMAFSALTFFRSGHQSISTLVNFLPIEKKENNFSFISDKGGLFIMKKVWFSMKSTSHENLHLILQYQQLEYKNYGKYRKEW